MLGSYLSTLGTFNTNIRRYLVAISLLGFTVDGGISSVVLNLFLLRLGFGPDVIGQINSVGLIVFAFSSMVAGALGNRLGNRRSMVLGMSIMMVANLLLPLVELTPQSWWRNWLTATVILSNVGVSMYFVNTAPYLMAAATPAQRTHAISIQSALIALAAFAGAMIGGVLPGLFASALGLSLTQAAPYRYTLLCAALTLNVGIFALLGAGDVEVQRPLPSTPRRWYTSKWRVPRLRMKHLRQLGGGVTGLLGMIAVIRVLQITGIAVTMPFFNVYLDTALAAPTAQIGLVTGLARLVSVPMILLIPLLAARWGNRRVAFWGSLCTALFVLPIALVPTVGAAGIGYMGTMASSSIRYTTFMIFTMELVQPKHRSLLSGLSEMTAGLSFAVMSWWGGFLIVNQGFQALFLVGAAGTLLGTLLYWAYFGLKVDRPQPVVALES